MPALATSRPSLRVLRSLPADMRAHVRLAEARADTASLRILPDTGAPALNWGATHEVEGWEADRFALNAMAQAHALPASHPFVWVGNGDAVHTLRPEGVGAWIPPGSLILVDAGRRDDILWAAEQVLRAPARIVCAVELHEGPRLAESRRLQVAAENGGSLGLILIRGRANSSTCQTRWHCENGMWALTKNKGGGLSAWPTP